MLMTPLSVGAMTSPHAAHGPGAHPAHEPQHDADGQTEILDLDAEVLAEHIASITAWLPVKGSPRHIVDLGCGTGAGTLALLKRFPRTEVTAVDTSASHLHRLRRKAEADGIADRVRTVQADLDGAWPELGTPELVWASASMHHMADPDHTLRQVHDTLAPNGLFAVVELAGFPRFLPEDAPANRPGLEERCHAALDRHHAEHVPHRGADWGPKLTAAGFTVEGERIITVNLGPPPHRGRRPLRTQQPDPHARQPRPGAGSRRPHRSRPTTRHRQPSQHPAPRRPDGTHRAHGMGRTPHLNTAVSCRKWHSRVPPTRRRASW